MIRNDVNHGAGWLIFRTEEDADREDISYSCSHGAHLTCHREGGCDCSCHAHLPRLARG